MYRVEVFDPAMCCSTGVCGPDVDPALVRFAADLEWLGQQGVRVDRYNLSQQPEAFVSNAMIRRAIEEDGVECLPVVLVDGRVLSMGAWPSREQLARRTVAKPKVALGAAPACIPKADGPGGTSCC